MYFFDEINELEYLYLISTVEPIDNQLLITIKAATVLAQEEDLFIAYKNLGTVKQVLLDGPGKEYEFHFNTYVTYSIVNESFSYFNDSEERIGRLFCIYSKSNYLDFVKSNTIAEFVLEAEIKHYAINCLNHIINIASIEEPIVTRS